MSVSRGVVLTLILAFVAFCVVQDFVTVAGAERYASLQREWLAGRGARVTVDEIMQPAVRSSVRQATVWGGVIAAIGLGCVALSRRNRS